MAFTYSWVSAIAGTPLAASTGPLPALLLLSRDSNGAVA
jgi:hypothetical protein